MPVHIVYSCTVLPPIQQFSTILFSFLLPDFQTSSKFSFYFVPPLLCIVFNFYSLFFPVLPSLLSPIFLFIYFILPLPLLLILCPFFLKVLNAQIQHVVPVSTIYSRKWGILIKIVVCSFTVGPESFVPAHVPHLPLSFLCYLIFRVWRRIDKIDPVYLLFLFIIIHFILQYI